jgi:membrane associated rhomboid family serine protease
MIPLRDDIPTLRFAYVTYVFLALNVLVWLYEVLLPQDQLNEFILTWGFVPARIVDTISSGEFAPAVLATLVTSTFIHGGWLHIIGNMLYLHIFGNNVEDSMGHARFVVFYLLIGVLANCGQVLVSPDSTVPGVGASGAIAGVLGAYLVLYPRAGVLVLVPIIFFIQIFTLPAVAVLGFWFLIQLFQGATTLAAGMAGAGGVAFWVHIAGFALGAGLIFLFRDRRLELQKAQVWY